MRCRGAARADGTVAAVTEAQVAEWRPGDDNNALGCTVIGRGRVLFEGGAAVTALVLAHVKHGLIAVWYDRYRDEFVCTPMDCHQTVGPV